MLATMTSKGQITVPKKVREQLNLVPGDRLEFLVEEDGTLRLVPISGSVTALKGMVPKPSRPVTLDEMDEVIRRRAAGR